MNINIEINGEKVVAQFAGRLDTVAATKVNAEMATLTENADKEITLDFTPLEFISSSGLRLLLSLNKQAKAKGGKVIISGANEEIRKVFKITGFANLFTIL